MQPTTQERSLVPIRGARLRIALFALLAAGAIAGCGKQSADDKQAADVARIRQLEEEAAAARKKKEAEEAASAAALDAENKARFAHMRAQAKSDAQTLGWKK